MPRLLVVDDEPTIVSLMRFILEKAGYEVVEAGNGVEALKLLGVEPPDPQARLPDLVVTDIMMPIMDGHTLSVKMTLHPRTKDIPLLVVTAKGDMRHLFESMPSVAAFFAKPFNPKDLLAAVAKALQKPDA